MTCATCGELPDEVWANTGRDQHLPAAARKLKAPWQFSASLDVRLCPECGAWFVWRDHPQFYGSGNLDEEQLTRLSPRAWRTLERLIHGELEPDPAAVLRDGFAAVQSDLLDEVVGKMPDEARLRLVPSLVEGLFTREHEAAAASILLSNHWRPGVDACVVRLLEAAAQPLSKRAQHLLDQCRASLAKSK